MLPYNCAYSDGNMQRLGLGEPVGVRVSLPRGATSTTCLGFSPDIIDSFTNFRMCANLNSKATVLNNMLMQVIKTSQVCVFPNAWRCPNG